MEKVRGEGQRGVQEVAAAGCEDMTKIIHLVIGVLITPSFEKAGLLPPGFSTLVIIFGILWMGGAILLMR